MPTIAETRLPGYEFVAWFGVFAPGTTPPDLVARISTLFLVAVDAPDTREHLHIQASSRISWDRWSFASS